MSIKIESGISYELPKVFLMQDTGIGTSEVAARTCYDSFESSENECIRNIDTLGKMNGTNSDLVNNIEHSNLLDDLAWTYFHHSILEHANLTYLIKGTSRGVLQEEARHRIQSLSVRSTRYTMSSVINAFMAELVGNSTNTVPSSWFISIMESLDLFVTIDRKYNRLQITDIFNKLKYQLEAIGLEEFIDKAVAKSSKDYVLNIADSQTLFNTLQAGKNKRNVGDSFKHLVNDNWKVDMVVTFNLRSIKNFFSLRDSGAAYFQIRWLAQAMKEVTPKKYLDLIIKDN